MGMSKDGRARIIRQRLVLLRQVEGVPLIEGDSLWLLSRPAKSPSDPLVLAEALFSDSRPTVAAMSQLWQAKETVRVDETTLNKWSRAAELVGKWRDLEGLIKEGVRGLKGWTAEEVRQLAKGARAKVDGLYQRYRELSSGNHEFVEPEDEIERAVARFSLFCHDEQSVAQFRQTLMEPISANDQRFERFSHGTKRFKVLLYRSLEKGSVRTKSPMEWQFVRSVRRQVARLDLGPRSLARLMFIWFTKTGEGERPLSFRELVRELSARWEDGLEEAIDRGSKAWFAARMKDFSDPRALLKWRAAAAIASLGCELSFPLDFTEIQYTRFIDITKKLSLERIKELGPLILDLAAHSQSYVDTRLLAADVQANLVERAYALDCAVGAIQLVGEPRSLRRYLDAVEELKSLEIKDKTSFVQDWFVSLFRGGYPETAALPLVMLTRSQGAIMDEDLASLYALACGLVSQRKLLVAALEEWRNPLLETKDEMFAPVLDMLAVDEVELHRYITYRQLLNHENVYSKELLAPFGFAEKETKEAAYLREKLKEEANSSLLSRLENLRDEKQSQLRYSSVVNRARRAFKRSLRLLERQSLEHLLNKIYGELLAELLDLSSPQGELPAGVRESLQLVTTDNRNFALFIQLLRHVMNEEDLSCRQENQDWLTKAEQKGLDKTKWLKGIALTVSSDREKYTVCTEKRPLEILKMGSYFGTCLALDDGFNAASTVLNALDVNKQVFYCYDAKGGVVGRKLIGASKECFVYAYNTYGFAELPVLEGKFEELIAKFCLDCGLQLKDKGAPEKLHNGFWYDDGSVSWNYAKSSTLPLPPKDIPRDERAIVEWNMVEALKKKEWDRLFVVGMRVKDGSSSEDGVAIRLFCNDIRRAYNFCRIQHWSDWCPTVEALIHRGDVSWMRDPQLLSHETMSCNLLKHANNSFPIEQKLLVKVIDELTRFLEFGSSKWHSHCLVPPARLARVGPKKLLRFFRAILSRFPDSYVHREEHWEDAWVDVLHLAYLHSKQSAPLLRVLRKRETLLERVVIKVAQRAKLPGSADTLRALLSQVENKLLDDVALALGTQERKKDGPFLLKLLRKQPTNLMIAVATVRCGDKKAGEEAALLWKPGLNISSYKFDENNLAFFRELNSHELPRRLRRVRSRLAAGGESAPAWIEQEQINNYLGKLGQLNADDNAGRPAPYFQKNVLLLPKQRKALNSKDGRESACNWWLTIRDNFPMRDFPFERRLDELLADSDFSPLLIKAWFQAKAKSIGYERMMERFIGLCGVEKLEKIPLAVIEQFFKERRQAMGRSIEMDLYLCCLPYLEAQVRMDMCKTWNIRGEAKHALEEELLGGVLSEILEQGNHPAHHIAHELVMAAADCGGDDIRMVLEELSEWMEPEKWELLAKTTLLRWRKNQPTEEGLIKFLNDLHSYRLAQHFVDIVWPHMPSELQRGAQKSLKVQESQSRGAWLYKKLHEAKS